MKASDLIAALERRHINDVFVAECKNGPSQTASHRRLDGWALLKTWSPITAIGYEAKVSRSDWLRDEKVASYLPLCHLLYIVAPKGVVKLEELPEHVGLLEPVGDGTRLVAKRKAARREVELPTNLLVYILMCRTKITRETTWTTESRMTAMRTWLADKSERQDLGHQVSEKIRKVFKDQQRRQDTLDEHCRQLEGVKRRIEELGFDTARPVREWEVLQKVNRIGATVNPTLLRHLLEVERGTTALRQELEGIRDAGKAA